MESLFGIIAFLFGMALLMFSFVNCALWLYLQGYKLYLNVIWERKRFLQWLNLQGLSKQERIFLAKGKYFDDLDVTFLSAVEDLELKDKRNYYMNRRNTLINQIRTEIDKKWK